MSDIEIDLTLPLAPFTLAVQWSTDERALGVFGASGAGKTSFLETLAGLRPRASGRLRIHGRTWFDSASGFRLPPEERGVGYVPQDGLLFPHRDVLGNVLTGARRARQGRGVRIDPERVLDLLGLTGRGGSAVADLSGGERQRVALARALCAGPELLLLDEPLGGLDLPLRRRILPYLLRVEREFGVPSIVVTHDAAEVSLLSREAIVLEAGRVAARGRPSDLFLGRDMLGRRGAGAHTNILRGRVVAVAHGTARLDAGSGIHVSAVAPPGLCLGDDAAVLVGAEELIVAVESPHGLSAQNVVPGVVRELIPSAEGGGSVAVTVDVACAREPLVAALTPEAAARLSLASGRAIFLVWKTHACRALAAGPATLKETA
ncbi:MAG TPA: ATP-binding cassette domain-containing protein [Verrucomicrobiae bacterium]|nr:ATP-binding cassette domain-containing protein [Verrucomicrobiae bacterium]